MKFPLALFGYVIASLGLASTALMIYICCFLPQCSSGGVLETDSNKRKNSQSGFINPSPAKQINATASYLQVSSKLLGAAMLQEMKLPVTPNKLKRGKAVSIFICSKCCSRIPDMGILNTIIPEK